MSVQRTGGQKIVVILNIFMVLAYGLGGIALFFWKLPSIPDYNRKVASGILILYAVYRAVRVFRTKKI